MCMVDTFAIADQLISLFEYLYECFIIMHLTLINVVMLVKLYELLMGKNRQPVEYFADTYRFRSKYSNISR